MSSKGFTAIEVLVSLGIFAVLLTTVMSAFMRGFASQKQILEMHAVQRDGVYIMEIISREIRMASDTHAPSNAGTNNPYFYFKGHTGKAVEYCRARWNKSSNKYQCDNTGDAIAFNSDIIASTNFEAMNSVDVKVVALNFAMSNVNFGTAEPLVTISMTLQSAKDPKVKLNLQSSVAMRLYYLHA